MHAISALQLNVLDQRALGSIPPKIPGANLFPSEMLQPLPGTAPTAAPAPGTAPAGQASFSQVLSNLVQDVNQKQVAAGEAVQGMMAGDNVSLHQAMIAMEEASISFQLMVEVRNKLLESYQELMRMQV